MVTKDISTRYFMVHHGADLTEGKGYRDIGIVKVKATGYHHEMLVEHWCYEKFGNKVGFVMGMYNTGCAMKLWTINMTSEERAARHPVLATLVADDAKEANI